MALTVLHVFPSFAPGGAQVRTLRLIEGLGDEYRHTVLPLDGRTDAVDTPVDPGARERLELLEPIRRAGSLRTARWLRGVIAERRPALLCTYNWGAIDALLGLEALGPWAAGTRPRAVLHHEEGFGPDEAERPLLRRTWARRVLLPRVDRVVVPSSRLHRMALERWAVPPERLRWIPNGVALASVPQERERDELRRALGLPLGAPVVGFVGPLRTEKNPRRLVEVLARLPDSTHLAVVGDGPEREVVRSLADRLGLLARVHLPGHQPDPAPWLRALDVYLVTSDTEQLPLALLEAMACARPVVALDVGDVGLALPEEQAHFVVPRVAEAVARLAERARVLLEDGAERRRLGAANRARVEREYRFETMVERHRAGYELAMG